MNIRKLKRRAMQRMNGKVVELRVDGGLWFRLHGLTHIQRENLTRDAIRSYITERERR
ncbi:MAG: hypothetical protein JSS14_22060 [Proteobacteria bacterium]|nr:hypothetical protein [Pseudomonadota bacterium]